MGIITGWVAVAIVLTQNIAWGMGPKTPSLLAEGKRIRLVCENPYERPTISGLKLDIAFAQDQKSYQVSGEVTFPDGRVQTIASTATGNVVKRELSLEIPDAGRVFLQLEMLEQGGPTLIGAVTLFGKTEELFLCKLR
jgi:hypothetical protein